MGFETKVLDEIEPLLPDQGSAYFKYGTLFVEGVTFITAIAIKELLESSFDVQVVVSKLTQVNEFAYDFVADTIRATV